MYKNIRAKTTKHSTYQLEANNDFQFEFRVKKIINRIN